MSYKKSFCVVCIANYCRSPVAENLLRHRFKDEYEFFSGGVSPIAKPNMDPRSQKFLRENDVNYGFHTPKKIYRRLFDYFVVFLAVDLYVLNQLNTSFPNYKKKFYSLTAQFKDINIVDPYRFNEDEYSKSMHSIKHVAENICLDDF